MKILLVEDEPAVAGLIVSVLEIWEQQVVWVQKGADALKALDTGDFNLLISDWQLPSMSGTELVERLRQRPDCGELPVLMISGRTETPDIVDAIQTGIDGYLSKPFGPTQLKEKIKEVVEKSRKRPPIAQYVRQILQGHEAFETYGDGPVVLFGEAFNTAAELLKPRRGECVAYLHRAVQAINALNAAHPGLKLGYRIETSTKALVEHIQRREEARRVKLVLMAPECAGNSLLTARLLNINRSGELSVEVVCERPEKLPARQAHGLKSLKVPIHRRRDLTQERLEELLRRCVLRQDGAPRRAAPEEVRRNLMADLENMEALPPLPQVYERILDLDRDSDSDIHMWAETIRLDPLSASVVLRHARSPAYGFTGEIHEVDRAVVLLGKKTVRNLVAGEAMRRAFSSVEESGFQLQDFWRHSIATGCAALALARPDEGPDERPAGEGAPGQTEFSHLGLDEGESKRLQDLGLLRRFRLDKNSEEPFTGGLVHDIGKAVMAQSYKGLFPQIVEEMKRRQWTVPMHQVETELTGGLTHATVGDILGQKWNLGTEVCRAVRSHHQPEDGDTYAFLIGIADFIAHFTLTFPRRADFPLERMLQVGDRDGLAPFLPAGFYEQPLLDLDELAELTKVMAPAVRRLTDELCYALG